MKNIFILTIVLGFSVSGLYAQEFRGKVKSIGGTPIPFATIAILNSPQGTVANENGEFSLALAAGSYQVSVRAVGFASRLVSISLPLDSGPSEIVLNEALVNLDAVVVTASKREEEIVKSNTSISSLSSQKVTDTRTLGLPGLTALVPNYLYQELGIGFQQIQSIRGIQVFSENPAVATYVDDVNGLDILANGFVFADIERIEVLRGPQGTLFGRNAMGGVVNIITKKPTNEPNGFVNLETGNLGLQRYSAGYKTPLVKDKLFFGANGLYQQINGFMKNDTTGLVANDASLYGRRVGDEQNLYGNVFLKWLPTENFNATLNLKGQRDWSEASGFFVSQPDEETALANPDKIFLNGIGRHDRRILNSALTMRYFTEKFTITSITAYQTIGLSFRDIDFPGFFHSFREKEIGEMLPPQEVWSQELRVSSTDNTSRLQYTAGVFGFSQIGFEPSTNYAFEIAPETYAVARNVSDNQGIAVFGEISYKLAEKLTATGGLRYDWESRKSIFGNAALVGGVFDQEDPDETLSAKYSALSPKLALAYAPGTNSNLYLSYNRGFRAGGINAQILPPGVSYTFDPEFSDNFELGYKMRDSNNRFSLAASAFYINWKDIQFFNVLAPGVFARENVGDGKSMGVELEASAMISKGFQVDGSLGLLNATYDDFTLTRVNFFTLEEVSLAIGGNRLSNAPSHTAFLGAQYTLPLSEKASFVIRGELRNIGEFYTDIQNDLRQPTYTLLNSKVGLNYGKYSLFVWGQNLTNERFLVFGTADSFSNRRVRTSAPRTFGVTFNVQF